MRLFAWLPGLFFLGLALMGCVAPPEPVGRVLATGLLNPIGLAELPDGGLLVAEMGTGVGDDSAGVTLLAAGGEAGRLVSGLPSSRDSGDLAGAPLVAVSADNYLVYLSFFNAHQLYTLPLGQALALPATPFTVTDLGGALAPQTIDRLINPFDLAFDPAGSPIVTDASMNGVARQTEAGLTHFLYLFDRLPDPTDPTRTIDAVPTGLARVGEEYWVTLTGGCPFPAGAGQLVAVGDGARPRLVLGGLNMPIDVAQDPQGAIWVLEFAAFRAGGDCFAGGDYLPNSGRLSRLAADGTLEPAVVDLNTPGAFLWAADGFLYISEVFPGRVLRLRLPVDEGEWPVRATDLAIDEATLKLPARPMMTLTPGEPFR